MSPTLPLRGGSGDKLTHVKTKIIATVGPACSTREKLKALVAAGADVFRLNFAHGKHEWLSEIVAFIRSISEELARPIGILGDLSGPKIRLHELTNGERDCHIGERIEFVRQANPQRADQLTSTYEPLVDDLVVGDHILLADGAVTMQVVEKLPDNNTVVCEVIQPGMIRSRQGINLPGVKLSTPSLTAKDREDLVWALQNQIDFIGLSFVRRAEDIDELRQVMEQHSPECTPQIVAKIEKMEAVDDLDRILEATDIVMVARGDLGVEVDIARVPGIQKKIIRLCNQQRVPVITATQMLDSMQRSSRPTRAEASDVANAVIDGSDAVMLSGESAAGDYPVESVAMMNRLVIAAEKLRSRNPPSVLDSSRIRSRALEVTEAITLGAGIVAETLGACMIVVATHSGKTALAISNQRLSVPVLGISPSKETSRKMAIYWGVTPLQADLAGKSPDQILDFVVKWGIKEGLLETGSKLILIASSAVSTKAHNQLLVHVVN